MSRRGWCPTVFEPMQTGDGLLARVKPPGSRLSAAQARALAAAAAGLGNGTVELTSRAHLQVRGLRAATVPAFARAMVAAGLAHADPAVERRRCVLLAPGADPAVALALEAALAAVDGLPAKFGVAVETACRRLGETGEDVVLTVGAAQSEIRLGGQAAAVATEAAVAAVLTLARLFAASGRRRMAEADGSALLRQAGLVAVPAQAGARSALALAGLPFGSGDAALWAALAGFGAVYLTPWRAVVVEAPAAELEALGLFLDPADPRWRVAACPGSPSCASGSVATRRLAGRLRPAAGVWVHVSGCEKGCARREAADWTLVGRAGAFDVVQGGCAGDAPMLAGLDEAAVAAWLAERCA